MFSLSFIITWIGAYGKQNLSRRHQTVSVHIRTLNRAFPSAKNAMSRAFGSVPMVADMTFSPSPMNASTLNRSSISRSFNRPWS